MTGNNDISEGIVKRNLIIKGKMKYINKIKDGIKGCILCKIRDRAKDVESVEILRTRLFIISCNLYPYNTGHIMIFPRRHFVDLRRMKKAEWDEFIELQNDSIDILTKLYKTTSYNIGLNVGSYSGASIKHLHYHLVPRYRSELGAIDIFSGSKIIIEDPCVSRDKLKNEFAKKGYKLNRGKND